MADNPEDQVHFDKVHARAGIGRWQKSIKGFRRFVRGSPLKNGDYCRPRSRNQRGVDGQCAASARHRANWVGLIHLGTRSGAVEHSAVGIYPSQAARGKLKA